MSLLYLTQWALLAIFRVVVKWSRTLWSLPPPSMSSACLLSMENFSQRISLIREVRYAETKENSQRRLNNNNVIIKHSQGPLVLSQGLKDNSLGHILWVVLYIIKHQVEKLITWWPESTQDMNCYNFENWNKWTLEIKINCTWNNLNDASQTTDDRFEDDC